MILDVSAINFALFGFAITGVLAILARIALLAIIILAGFVLSSLLKKKIVPAVRAKLQAKGHEIAVLLLDGFTKPLASACKVVGILVAGLFLPWSTASIIAAPFLLLCLRLTFLAVMAVGFWNASPVAERLFNGTTSKFDFAQSKTVSMVVIKAYKTLVVLFFIIALMNEFNFDITSLVAGLGLVGLTISLAAQDSASNLFSGLLILIERPFGIGDWISVNGVDGIVEDISFRSTKIRALDNSLYVLPNATVSGTTINNGTNRQKRMYRFTLGVTYDTTRPMLEALMVDIEAMLKAHESVDADSVIVRLAGFGDSSIDLLVSCYVNIVDLPAFLGVQNELHLNIMDLMAKNNASFAFPSTTVYLETGDKK